MDCLRLECDIIDADMESNRIELRLYASLRKWRDPPIGDLAVGPSVVIQSLLGEIGIPADEVAVVFLNGRRARLEDKLADGDVLSLFPAIGGG